MFLKTAYLPILHAILATLVVAHSSPNYHLDTTWSPQFPHGTHTFSAVGVSYNKNDQKKNVYCTQRGNSTLQPVQVLSSDGTFLSSWGAADVAIATPGKTWGAHGLSIERCENNCDGGQSSSDPNLRVWIEDFTNHTVTAFTSDGKKLLQVGTPGIAGNGTSPLQFDHVADAVVVSAPSGMTSVYASDGDGGYANRVSKFNVDNNNNEVQTEWVTDHVFNNPHSIAMHQPSGLLIVADREQQALKLINSQDGTVLPGNFNCHLSFGTNTTGVPFGVRTYYKKSSLLSSNMDVNLLFVASMDNPQDHKHQKISVLDVSKLTLEDGVDSECFLIQELFIDPQEYSGPHLMGVDPENGDLYAALVADVPHSTVLRFTMK